MPQSLKVLRPFGGRITGTTTTHLDEGEARRVSLEIGGGDPVTFSFADDESLGLPMGDYAAGRWRLEALNANGAATTGTPVYYRLYSHGHPGHTRLDAATGMSLWQRTATERTITTANTAIEEIYTAGSALRQIKTASCLVDILETGTLKYTISFYTTAQVGTKDANGIYSLLAGATAYTTITVENPPVEEGLDLNHLVITRATDTGGTQVYDYQYVEASDQWTLQRGDGTTTLTKNTLRSTWNEAHTQQEEVREFRDGDNENWGQDTFWACIRLSKHPIQRQKATVLSPPLAA